MAKDAPKPREVEVTQDFLGSGEEYHFSGGMEFEPMTVRAASLSEATKVWEKTRIPTGSPLQEKSDTI